MADVNLSALIWSVADLLRGDYRQSEYGKVILPFTVLRRLDCILAPTKAKVLAEKEAREAAGMNPDHFMRRASGEKFYNASPLDMGRLIGDQDNIAPNLGAYVDGFSPEVRDIFERFGFALEVDKLAKNKLLYQVTERFARLDLGPATIGATDMGLVFEELIRRFAEASNDTAGEHFTPREVIRLMVHLLFTEDDHLLQNPGVIRSIYDPTAGTGGMLSVADEYRLDYCPDARFVMSGQELNDLSYAICKADMLIKKQDVTRIVVGNTLSDDGHAGETFNYMLANPPFGVEWKKVQKEVKKEHEEQGFNGRFGPGLPRVSDGSLLFLMHLLSKMQPKTEEPDSGSRFCIVLNGSPLFTGGAGSGESEIRRYVLEHDLVEAIVALPTDMFYNTGIATYVWVVTNKKAAHRKGLTQLIDGSPFWHKMRKSLGSKRREMGEGDIDLLSRLFGQCAEAELATLFDADGREMGREVVLKREPAPEPPEGGKAKLRPLSLLVKNESFGYRQITVERPLRDENGEPVRVARGKRKGELQPDPALRDTENVPLGEDVAAYMEREVLAHAPDAWVDEEKTRVGYEIPFNRHFYVFEPPRELAEIDADLAEVTRNIQRMLAELAA
ncbi:type I restriction-modification system subunit M [Acuticoccus mangrovi]|uniref:site-specific DNA-methyltransferase (adenine-specific) n=1 Tax=Acuticoccus mangrovi TaxID=2796142 RepID=A0A934ILP3_9HYPH|nr:class I SAM-dependent DNA methyltransferase [Acuticoccus mangrovi]MBJ3778894.1 SAM-dependent DNA methyltransferase [Acuticoccus mangrovi]